MTQLITLLVSLLLGLPPKVGATPNLHSAAQPPGFPTADEFQSSKQACAVLVPRMVEREDLRKPVLDWCLSRVYHASRNVTVVSRIDGSQIHDRDRPAARAFYKTGVRAGYINPKVCKHHEVDKQLKQPPAARALVERWPYTTHCDYDLGTCTPNKRGRMEAAKAARWLKHSPDYERFSTRGPTDHNFWVATKYLGGCFAPEAMDRHDVSTAVTIARSVALCERLERTAGSRRKRKALKAYGLPTGCRRRSDLRAIWGPRFWFETLRYAFAAPSPA